MYISEVSGHRSATLAIEKAVKMLSPKCEILNINAFNYTNPISEKVINRILEAGEGNFTGGLTTRKYVSIAGVSRATAFREITDLLDKQILRQMPGKGRSAHYDLLWPRQS